MGATDPPLLLSAASDARVSMWSPSTWRPVNDFGGDDPYVFGGEEAWMGPRVTRAMVYPPPGSVRGLLSQRLISLVAHLQAGVQRASESTRFRATLNSRLTGWVGLRVGTCGRWVR
jgi:hypothetical protein